MKVQVKSARAEAGNCRKPCLAIILVGNNTASTSYVTKKMKACKKAGI